MKHLARAYSTVSKNEVLCFPHFGGHYLKGGGSAKYKTKGLLAHSNVISEPAATALNLAKSTLDGIATGAPDQKWTISVSNANLNLKDIGDVLFAIEYSADARFGW